MQTSTLSTLRKSWGLFRWYTSMPGIRQLAMRIQYLGFNVECPYCGWRGKAFYPNPEPHPRPNAYCPRCFAKERHRLLYLYLEREMEISISEEMTVLEIAPGLYSIRHFSNLPHIRYITADLESDLAQCHADICCLPLPSETFDLVICYHVLEHIPDDRAVMVEFHRILKRGGVMLVQVPIVCEVTEEDPTVTDPQERLRRFGQDDHVRNYGLDFYDRLNSVGFDVRNSDFAARLSPGEILRYGLDPDELIIVCTAHDADGIGS